MKKITLIAMIFISSQVIGQQKHQVYTESDNPIQEYNVVDVDETSDQGKIILSTGINQSLYVTKLDASGNLEWDVSISASVGVGQGKIEQHANGNYILTYTDASNEIRLVYLDATGTLIWGREFQHPTEPVANDHSGVAIDHAAAFPEFIVYGTVGNNHVPWMARVGNTGATMWQYSYNNFGFLMNGVEINDVIVSSTGFIYAVASSPTEKYLMKFDQFGNMLILKVMDMGTYLQSIIETSNGDIVVVGYFVDIFGTEDVCFMRLDPVNMNLIDARTYGTTNNERGLSVTENLDNSFAIAVEDNSTGSTKSAIYKLDNAHTLEWARAYGGNGTEVPSEIFENAGGGWTMIGSSTSFSPSADIHLVMTDINGETVGCIEEIGFADETTNTLFVNPVVFNQTSTTVSNNAQPITVKGTVADTIIPYPTINITPNDPLCNGGTGSALLNVSGGVIPYNFQWSNGTTAQHLNNVFAGPYSVVMEDGNGCHVETSTNLVDPPAIMTSSSNSAVSCAGAADATIDLTVSGGTPGYSYNWTNGSTNEDLTNIPGGFYQVTVTDNNGCTAFHAVSVQEPTALIAGLNTTVDPLCHDDCNGSLGGIASGGTAPYQYLWNDPMNQTTSTATNLCAGNYLLTVTDANSCMTIVSGSLQNPDELSTTIVTTPSDCGSSSGTAQAQVNGGTMPYNYLWPLGSTLDNETGLNVGSYSVDITDANGCVLNESFSIGSITNPVQMCVVTVNDNNQNVVVWEKPVVDNIAGFNIYRNIAGVYTQVGYRPYDSLSQYVDTDFGIDPTITSYRYRISVIDTCGNESQLSDYHETIHLTTSVGISNEVNLIWDDYEGVAFTEYLIYRDTTNLGNWELIGTVPSTNFTYVDLNVPSNISTVRYAVDIVLPATCTSTKAQDYNSSRSNNSSSVLVDPSASVAEMNLQNAKVYPNPTDGDLTIEMAGDEWSFEIRDMSGRLVLTESNLFEGQEVVDLSWLESGAYILVLIQDGESITKRIIVQ